MANLGWYVNRLRAMSVREVLWRLEQKQTEKAERRAFQNKNRAVTKEIFRPEQEGLTFHAERLAYREADSLSVAVCPAEIPLLGGYAYAAYKKDWHAGFQTKNVWPRIFSYDLQYKQRDEIGDARTNWELSRHFQFAMLSCRYYHTGEEKYLEELEELFHDWNEQNPFLTGISWTSVMEAAIRDINWIYTLGFLMLAVERRSGDGRQGECIADGVRREQISRLCGELHNGIVNMTDYISEHHSRYSSANNHLIVEAAAMGMAGIVMNCAKWYDTAFYILQYEMERQNYRDGVNKEVSLHYQSFFMEAVGLLILTMQKNKMAVPQFWRNMLTRMSRYLADCQGNHGEAVVFGDDDAGKILDLEGIAEAEKFERAEQTGETKPAEALAHESVSRSGNCENKKSRNHYAYVLQLMSIILPERYTEEITDSTLLLLITDRQREEMRRKPYYKNAGSICYEEGGISILKSRDGRALIGIDHGELGFGSIAAHGHADALSFQLYLDGVPVFADAGTYLYHTDLESRNSFRRTENHNTLTVDGKDQSQMLGAFLWGKRARTKLYGHNLPVAGKEETTASGGGEENHDADRSGNDGTGRQGRKKIQYVDAAHDGYAPVIHRRKYEFDGGGRLRITDRLLNVEKKTGFCVNFLCGASCEVIKTGENTYRLCTLAGNGNCVEMKFAGRNITVSVEETWISESYGQKKKTKKVKVCGSDGNDAKLITEIWWKPV